MTKRQAFEKDYSPEDCKIRGGRYAEQDMEDMWRAFCKGWDAATEAEFVSDIRRLTQA